jgi:hypothetical protein
LDLPACWAAVALAWSTGNYVLHLSTMESGGLCSHFVDASSLLLF